MESFTIALVSNASAQLLPDNTLSTFTKFLQEQLNLGGQCELALSEIPNPSMCQNVTEGDFRFCYKKFSNSSKFYYLEPGIYPFITDNVEAMNILVQERHNHIENCIKVKCLEKRKRLRFTLQMKHPVYHSLVRIWDTLSEVMLIKILEYGWEGKDLTNQNLLTTLSAYTLS